MELKTFGKTMKNNAIARKKKYEKDVDIGKRMRYTNVTSERYGS